MTRLPLLVLAATVLAVSATGCEDDVDPTLGLDAPFSLYGYLDPTADRQAVRVVPITDVIAPDDDGTIDAAVTSTDLDTGEVTEWRDSLATFADGTTGWVFVADYTPRAGATVRIEARRSDGDASTAEVVVPPIVQPSLGSAENVLGDVFYPVSFAGVPRVLNGQLRLTVLGLPASSGAEPGDEGVLVVPVQAEPVQDAAGRWSVRVPFVSSVRRYLEAENLIGAGLRLVESRYVGFVADGGWSLPTDDLDALVEPGVFSNVASGFGFVGAGYFAPIQWDPPPAVQIAAGFTTSRDVAVAIALNELMPGPGGWVEFYNPLDFDVNLAGYTVTNDQSVPGRQTLPAGTVVPGRGFAFVFLDFSVEPDEDLSLYNARSVLIQRLPLPTEIFPPPGSTVMPSFGSFPDGLSLQLPQSGPNIFRGPLTPTPGGPNTFGLAVAAINEIYTEGTDGWVEAVVFGDYRVRGLQGFSDPDDYLTAQSFPANNTPFRVADEAPGRLELPQAGGTVYIAAAYDEPRVPSQGEFGPPTIRVVDARTYGPQTPGRSVGYLPDAPDGVWTQGLAPTEGAPNAAARLGL